ncbi:hypothetical protein L9W80_18540 [Vibrio aestuarianus]|uniref:hypothetical protein n=1 Tax=Vibrio TaxID=662 RepID=UPI001483C685|nr:MULTISPECIES: hypothetical protein [Vibrio]MDE1352136.1 hypothetical protein [Vibrio aestuarianus]NNO00298.1 hypothetical protein [Vibrio sp. B1-2]
MFPKFNLRLVGVLIILVIIAVTYITDQKYYNDTIRSVLEWKHLNISIWFGCFICFVLHYLSAKSSNAEYAGLIYKQFGIFADSAFAAITYGLAMTTSASILKGVYVQQFFGDVVYFNHFESLDIYSMLVVCLFLLGYSFWSCTRAAWEAIIFSSAEKAEAVYD